MQNITDDAIIGFYTPDAVINPFLIVEAYREELQRLGVKIIENFDLIAISKNQKQWTIKNEDSFSKSYDIVVNATGSWVNDICRIIGLELNLTYIDGSMAILENSLVDRVITACAPNRTGDVIIPSGNRMMIGSTWHELDNNIPIQMTDQDKETCVNISSELIPQIRQEKVIGSFTGIRTHEKPKSHTVQDFAVKRKFSVIDHTENGFEGIFSILAGKLSFGRLVAEEATNLICKKLTLGLA